VRGNSDDETPSATAQSVNKHAVPLVNILDSRRSFLLKYAPINAINILATKSKRTVIIQTDTEKILDIAVNRDSFFFFSIGLPVANAPDVLQPCGLLYYP